MVDEANTTGIVYILSNVAMDGYIKIGITRGDSPKHVQERMKSLDSTGVPRAFDCEYAAVVANYDRVESALHVAFGDFRVRENREFFEGIAPFRVKAVLKLHEIKDVTPRATDKVTNLEDASEKERQPKRPALKFSMVEIPIGASLQWADDPGIRCTVTERNRVLYEGNTYSLSGLAKELKGMTNTPAGPLYWLYEEETLAERRRRFEEEGGDDEE